ncbi:hypothetical protein BDZ45DRAFT_723546 [Acephala macrosclerotiorum]|nr:hypothetical protein BDZ45DRAFT_723546 [Acephala macrosclerotiorum]
MADSTDGQAYRSVLRIIAAERKKRGIRFEYMSRTYDRIVIDMQKICGYQLMSQSQEDCWVEWHLWEEAFEVDFPYDKSILNSFYRARIRLDPATEGQAAVRQWEDEIREMKAENTKLKEIINSAYSVGRGIHDGKIFEKTTIQDLRERVNKIEHSLRQATEPQTDGRVVNTRQDPFLSSTEAAQRSLTTLAPAFVAALADVPEPPGRIQAHEILAAIPAEGIKIGELMKVFQERIGEGGDKMERNDFLRLVEKNTVSGPRKLLRPKEGAKSIGNLTK